MQNITLSMDKHLLQLGREYARKNRTSLNNIIRELLSQLVSPGSKNWADEAFSLADREKGSSKGKKWKREDLYDI